jgi:hypothetical protein
MIRALFKFWRSHRDAQRRCAAIAALKRSAGALRQGSAIREALDRVERQAEARSKLKRKAKHV